MEGLQAAMHENTSELSREFAVASLEPIHHKVIEIIGSFPKGKALDLPAGSGRLSWFLYRKGFDVVAGDIEPNQFRNPELPAVKADLDDRFPFESNTFDYAFCIEGPEHVENPYHTFREFARVLRKEGRLIISYPNYSNLESRVRNVFYGILEPVEPLQLGGKPVQKNNGHINRQPYGLLRMSLEYAGFRIDSIHSESVKKGQKFLYPLYLLIRMFTWLQGDRGRKKYWLHESNAPEVLMGGNSLIVVSTLLHK